MDGIVIVMHALSMRKDEFVTLDVQPSFIVKSMAVKMLPKLVPKSRHNIPKSDFVCANDPIQYKQRYPC